MFSLRSTYSNASQNVLNKFGDVVITQIRVTRTPLHNILQNLANFFSSGASKAHYDKLFHLALIFTLQGGKNILVEKNEEIDISENYKIEKETEIKNVNLNGRKLTIKEMLNNTLKGMGVKNYFTYSALKYNCQNFCVSVLRYNNLLTEDLYSFIYQDMKVLIKNIPSKYQKFMNAVTNTKAWINKIIGTGEEEKKRKRIKMT